MSFYLSYSFLKLNIFYNYFKSIEKFFSLNQQTNEQTNNGNLDIPTFLYYFRNSYKTMAIAQVYLRNDQE